METDQHERMLNHLRICQLLARAAQQLIQVFLKRWHDYKSKDWDDGEECVAELLQLCDGASPQVKEALTNKSMDLWDVTAACFAIQAISAGIHKNGGSIKAEESKAVFDLRNARNEFYHGKSELSKEEFNTKWNHIANMLVKLGDNYADIKELKVKLMGIGKSEVMVSKTETQSANIPHPEDKKAEVVTVASEAKSALDKNQSETILLNDEDTLQKLKEGDKDVKAVEYSKSELKLKYNSLKDEANKLFKNKEYNKAIDVYSKILQIPGLIPEDQAMILSNLSASHLMQNNKDSLKMAKNNANWAIQLWPCWWRGYFRLAMVQAASGEWRDAEESLGKALALNPSSEEARKELNIVRGNNTGGSIIVSKEEDHLNELRTRGAMGKKKAKKAFNKLMNSPGSEVLVAEKFLREKNYPKAIQNFEIAAKRGEPDALYYLGRMYHEGEGVERDYKKSMEYLLKAATTYRANPVMGGCISGAQYLIGKNYADGVGVEKDYRKAAEWYEKSINNGFPDAASELGVMYTNGLGVKKSLEKAFNYFKLAAELGNPYGMCHLGICYMNAEGIGKSEPTEEDLALAKKWLQLALKKGYTDAQEELKTLETYNKENTAVMAASRKLVNDISSATDNPMDKEQYGPYIKVAAKKGSLIAQRHLDIWKYLYSATEAFRKTDPVSGMAAFSNAIRLDDELTKIPEIFYPLIEDRIKTNPDDLDTVTCFIHTRGKQNDGYHIEEKIEIKTKSGDKIECYIHLKGYKDNGQLIDKYLIKFPNNEYLLEQRAFSYIGAKEFNKALTVVDRALLLYPKSLRLLYCRAIIFSSQANKFQEVIKAFDDFINAAPKDHDKVPACHYQKALSYYRQGNNSKFVESYEAGLEAEKLQLPCFMPYKFAAKSILEKIYDEFKDKKQQPKASKTSKKNLNSIKLNVQRKFLIPKCRKVFAENEEKATICAQPGSRLRMSTGFKKTQKLPKPPSLVSLKKITLQEMDPTEDKIYDGFVLEATIIDWSFVMGGISTVIEDENGNVQRLTVYNWPSKDDHFKQMADVLKTFCFNTTVSIINPYMRLAADGLCFIRVENPAYIKIDNFSAENKCHVCGKKAETMKCGRCLMAKYCSKECQIYDCKELEHNIICKHLKKYSSYF